MKLKDLHEAFDTVVSDKTTSRSFQPGVPQKTDDELGRGSFSIARNSKDPATIKKRQFNDPGLKTEKDVFQDYAQVIYHNKLWDKIHFPRIYSAKKLTDKDGKTLHRWEMEKLLPLDKFAAKDHDALYNLFARYVPEDYAMSVNSFLDVMKQSVLSGNTDKVDDENLARALKWLHQMAKHFSKKYEVFRIDMRASNIMIRLTNTGPQLVFTDPFWAPK
jgi:hypothetical protein